jgi:hypothetical protein
MHPGTIGWPANRLKDSAPAKTAPGEKQRRTSLPGELVARHGVQWHRGRAHLTSLRARRRPPVGNHRRLVPQNFPAARGPVHGGV